MKSATLLGLCLFASFISPARAIEPLGPITPIPDVDVERVVEVLTPREGRFADEIALFALQEPEKGGIVFTGSSSIRLWPDLAADFPGLPVLNRGFGGSVATDLSRNFDKVIADAEPKLLVVYTGDNDLHAGLSVNKVFDNYTRVLRMARERFPQMRAVIISVKVAPKRAKGVPRVIELNERLAEWAAETGWARFVDCTSALTDEKGDFIHEYFHEDTLHLSEAGYVLWKGILEPVVREEWEKVN